MTGFRQSQDFKDYTLRKMYGVLKTYELEMQLDEEIERIQSKNKTIALVAKNKGTQDGDAKAMKDNDDAEAVEGTNESRVDKVKSKVNVIDYYSLEDFDQIDEHLFFYQGNSLN